MLSDTRRTIEEAYSSATTSSDLRVQADHRSDADVLIAAGWSPGIVGAAALRLCGEWDRAEKPRRGQNVPQELQLLAMKLKSFRSVRDALSLNHLEKDKAQRLIFWWLDQKCQPCGGTKFETVKNTNRHGSAQCRYCRGSGLAPVPFGEDGKRAANFLDDCVQRSRQSISKRLRSYHPVA